ncbi:MAG: aldolase/citrate lyase family protein [Anaerovoracaceae bacterium]|nr:aldolase/citrate lyase family protein [Anaerovoracaceae bacterium]
MENRVREKLDAGEKVYGTFIWSSSDTLVECMGYTGLDYVIIDSEHSPIATEGAVNMIRTAKLKGLTPFVRVSDVSRPAILKMLDSGAEALIIPCLRTADEVRKIVEYGKYQPVGQRGFAQCRRAGWGYEDYAKDLHGYFEVSNAETLLFPMCETAEFLEDIDEIIKIDGVDGIFVGPYDLSVALGKPGVFDTQEFRDSLRRIADVCRENGKYSLIFSNGPEAALEHFSMGYQGTALSMDVQMIIEAYRGDVSQIKENI